MMSTSTIPQFLLPRGISQRTLRYVAVTTSRQQVIAANRRGFASMSSKAQAQTEEKARVLGQPDKFRPPSHPARRVMQTRNGKVVNAAPYNYPGPPPSAKEKEEQKTRRYPNMFPPEGTVMYKFLTTRWIHVWIAMGVLTSLATFTFSENFKRTSPFAHLLPPWSGLLAHPIDTISQVLSVYRMHVQHNSMLTREKRHRRIDDAEKRRQYRIAHGLEEPDLAGAPVVDEDDQSPIAPEAVQSAAATNGPAPAALASQTRPVKKWLGIF